MQKFNNFLYFWRGEGGLEPKECPFRFSPYFSRGVGGKYEVGTISLHVDYFLRHPLVLKMPFLRDYFGKHRLPVDMSCGNAKNYNSNYNPGHSLSPTVISENGAINGNNRSLDIISDNEKYSNTSSTRGRRPTTKGSLVSRMIANECKIMSMYSGKQNSNAPIRKTLPAITPQLMKSRRRYSLQLAIGEIINNNASVYTAATKYNIPRATLHRQYQRYLKTFGMNNQPEQQPEKNTNLNTNQILELYWKVTVASCSFVLLRLLNISCSTFDI